MSKTRVWVFVVAGMLMASMASPAWAVLLKAADWQMNETDGPMLDSSGNGNNGTPTDVLQTGSNYVFNGSTSHVLVPDADSLDPQANDITLTASVMVNGTSLDDDSYDVVRKGLVTTPGGDYKMEIKRVRKDPTIGRLHCFFRGTEGTVAKVARRDIVDGNWHTLQCVKTSGSVVAKVDGRSYTKTGSAGSIANASNVMVGAKQANPMDDVFDGSMDFVSIDIASSDSPPPETTTTSSETTMLPDSTTTSSETTTLPDSTTPPPETTSSETTTSPESTTDSGPTGTVE